MLDVPFDQAADLLKLRSYREFVALLQTEVHALRWPLLDDSKFQFRGPYRQL